jgi:hypothetical protein
VFCPCLQQYGDHLYDEKDFDGSIVQYAQTIGYIPSSSVITYVACYSDLGCCDAPLLRLYH